MKWARETIPHRGNPKGAELDARRNCGDRAVGEPTTPCGRAKGHDLWDAFDRTGCARIFGLTRGGKCIADMGVKRKGRLVAAKERSRKSVVGSQLAAA